MYKVFPRNLYSTECHTHTAKYVLQNTCVKDQPVIRYTHWWYIYITAVIITYTAKSVLQNTCVKDQPVTSDIPTGGTNYAFPHNETCLKRELSYSAKSGWSLDTCLTVLYFVI